VGRAYGAQDHAAIGRAGWTAFWLAVVFMAAMSLTMILAPRLLISAFLDIADPNNDEVIYLAISFLFFAALFQIADGAQAVGSNWPSFGRVACLPVRFQRHWHLDRTVNGIGRRRLLHDPPVATSYSKTLGLVLPLRSPRGQVFRFPVARGRAFWGRLIGPSRANRGYIAHYN
jgi:hypothetical protein